MIRLTRRTLAAGSLAACCLVATAWAEPGTVVSSQKIDQESALGRAWPSPFHSATTIPFRLKQAADIRIDICDPTGRRVRSLLRARMPAGDHQTVWDARDDAGRTVPNGIYFLRMAIDGRPVWQVGKALLLR